MEYASMNPVNPDTDIQTPGGTEASPDHKNMKLDPNAILIAEYNYSAQAADRAIQVQTQVIIQYGLVVGAVAGYLLGVALQSSGSPVPFYVSAFVLGFAGLVSLAQFWRFLRQRLSLEAAHQAMSAVEAYYSSLGDGIKRALYWPRNAKAVKRMLGEPPVTTASIMGLFGSLFLSLAASILISVQWTPSGCTTDLNTGITTCHAAAFSLGKTQLSVLVFIIAFGIAAGIHIAAYLIFRKQEREA